MLKANASESNPVRDSILAAGQRMMAARGFTAVGLNDILTSSGVPKGSFYHYFSSKEAYGEAMLNSYFDEYLAEIDKTLAPSEQTMAQRVMNYFADWRDTQSFMDCQGKCLAVKLGAEVADLSESMRLALKKGTAGITGRLAKALEVGVAEGSLTIEESPEETSESLYQLWLGASVMVKIVRHRDPFEAALKTTRQILHLSP
ncbi:MULTISPECIES: TetR/AcrR family transcriptional regulator [unclassified Variovorax]|uniref:TetR/AcrR family transcriptional regulator n=1 Tax=unclassified Variovorax TaxID=663243 RepID=UPI0008CD8C7A|nr:MULTISPECIES: TetR/AcrR family transcriptional regulator [unclassified Variovorax]SEK17340.1 transcriptional regulator, TetR family [Variovorax sp. OK202]SFE80249.1 transcriptional regulator, TetR family [Variovorax sp. OK212]